MWATTLLAYAYMTYLAGRPGRATSGAGNPADGPAAGGGPGTGGAGAASSDGRFWPTPRPLAGALGWAHGTHRCGAPVGSSTYALALLPLVGAYCGLAAVRVWRKDDLWPTPLQNGVH